ncbi:MAG: YlxM family DNA-binding protein [Caldicoprobacterales bacterium]
MDKFQEMALLLDTYGELLTDKQRDVMDQYYNYDLSLQEIAENAGISKQGVHDLIRRAEQTLVKADKKLGFQNRLSRLQNGLETVRYILEDLSRELHASESQASKLDVCREEVEKLINTCLGG